MVIGVLFATCVGLMMGRVNIVSVKNAVLRLFLFGKWTWESVLLLLFANGITIVWFIVAGGRVTSMLFAADVRLTMIALGVGIVCGAWNGLVYSSDENQIVVQWLLDSLRWEFDERDKRDEDDDGNDREQEGYPHA